MVVGNDHVGFSARLTWRLFQDKDLLVWTFLEHHQGTIGPTFPPLQGVFSMQKQVQNGVPEGAVIKAESLFFVFWYYFSPSGKWTLRGSRKIHFGL